MTLSELGVDADPSVVAQAITEGFAATLDINFNSRLGSTSSIG